jgi:adenylate kinase family enzyme
MLARNVDFNKICISFKNMIKHINILGATGSGTTTLGKALSNKLAYVHFDNDNYMFESNKKVFTKPRKPLIRDSMLFNDLKSTPKWVLSGEICGWGDFILRYFDLVIFLWVPVDERMKWIEAREEKLSRKIEDPTHPRYKNYENFMRWASEYDTGGLNMRSLAKHEEWMKKLSCPVLRIKGNKSIEENLLTIVNYIKHINEK